MEVESCIIELKCDELKYKLVYPQTEPTILTVTDALKNDSKITLTILLKLGSKYKKIARGVFNIYSKYFQTGHFCVEKRLHLHLFENNLSKMGHNSLIVQTMSNVGKIDGKAVLLNPPESAEKKIKLDSQTVKTGQTIQSKILKNNIQFIKKFKENVAKNRTERFRSVVKKENDFLKNILKGKGGLLEESLWEECTSGFVLNRRRK